MNKLLTNINGGFPFVLDDIRFSDEAYRNAFKGILKTFDINNTDRFIISGCEVTQTLTTYNISQGWVYYDGEIYPVDAQSIAIQVGPNSGYYYAPVISYDPAGNKTFEDGNNHDTYEVRKAKVYFGTLPANALLMQGQRLMDLITDYVSSNLSSRLEAVNLVGQQGQPSFGFGWANYPAQEPVGFFKNLEGTVIMQGRAIKNFGNNSTVFTLPTAYRPNKNRWFITNGEDNSGNIIAVSVTIISNGNVQVSNVTNNNTVRGVSFEGISYRI